MQDAPFPFPPSLEGRYKQPRFLSAGGAGAVYAARDEHLFKQVAIKLMTVNSGDQKLLRFQQEAKVIAKFTHPNIVTALDFGLVDEQIAYLVLDLVGDASLNALIQKREPLSVLKCLNIFRQICSGMAYAHARGVLHRDLKPSNILLEDSSSPHPVAKIADFGIAKISGTLISATTGNIYIGTPAYTSPEQFCGDDVDERSDIYSLGCLMFATLTGTTPFEGDNTAELALKHAKDQVPQIERTYSGEDIPESLQEIVETCLEKSREDRYSNFTEVEQLINQLLNELAQPTVQTLKKIATTGSFSTTSSNPYSDSNTETPFIISDGGGSKQAIVAIVSVVAGISLVVVFFLLGFDTNFFVKGNSTTSGALPPAKLNSLLEPNPPSQPIIKKKPKLSETERNLPVKILMETAEYKMAHGDPATAIAFFDRILEVEPKSAKALKLRSDCKKEQQDYESGLDDINIAIALKQNYEDDKLILRRAHLRKEVGDLPGAKADLKTFLKLNPKSAKHYKEYAKLCEMNKDNYKEAIENYSKSIALDPTDDSAFKGRARLYATLNEDQKAIADFTSAIALKPNDADFYRSRGSIRMISKQFQESADDFSAAIKLDPRNAYYYSLRADAYNGLGELNEAKRDRLRAQELTQAQELNP